jgi:Protein of unknown function (DUF3052)
MLRQVAGRVFSFSARGLPAGARLGRQARSPLDVILLFVTERRPLERRLGTVAARMMRNGGLWVCWPKRASGVQTDVTEDVVREIALAAGLVDNKVCAVDETWSGLRVVYRLSER